VTAIDVAPDPSFGLRTEQGAPPQTSPPMNDGGDAVFGAAFRQSNSVVSALQYMRNTGSYEPVPGYNPLEDIKGWKQPNYFLDHGDKFIGSQSPAETYAIKDQIDQETADKQTLAANGKIGFIAQTVAGSLDPTMLLPGGVALDAAKGGLTFSKAAIEMGKAGFMQTVSQEALLHASQQTRTFEESAINVASGTLLTALIGGAAASLLSPAERAAAETALHADRAEMNAHAGNPGTGEMAPQMPSAAPGESIPLAAANANEPTGTAAAASVGAAASDTRKLELVDFGLNKIPGVGRVVEKTSPMQRVFGADSPTARRTGADLAETSLLFKENLEGKVTTAGPALDREARLMIHQGQVAVGDELSSLFSQYRFGEEKTAPRARAGFEDLTGRAPEGKMSFSEFKEAVSDAMRSGDQHEIPQVQQAAQTIRLKIFEPWKKRAIDAGLLGEDVDVKTADSYLQRLYNKQAIAAKRPEFLDRVTDWLQGDQQAKAQAQQKISAYHGALQVATDQIDKVQARIAKLEADADVIAARQEETTRINKAANRRAEKLRTKADQDSLPLDNARGGAVFETLARNRGNLLADRASAKLAEIESLEQKLARETANHDSMRAKIEDEIARWEGKSTTEAKAALKAREEAERAREAKAAATGEPKKGGRLEGADKAVDRAVARILKSERDLPRAELRARADEITNRILGSPDGRLPYDLGMEHGTAHGGSGEQPRGALAAREFNIPDATIRDFLENDVEHIVASHLRTMVPDVLLTEKFGDTRMTEAFRKINDEYAALADGAKSDKERTRLENERQGVISDLSSIRDRIRGTYAISSDAPMRNAARALNVLTSMGSAALSSLPDMAGTVLRHGLTSTFNDAWAPFFNLLTRQSDVWKEAGRQYRAMGIAVESVLASRHHALTDTLDTYHPQSRVERTMQWATGKFQFVNMLAPWTDFAKINASMVAGSEILRAVKASAGGTANARMLRTLGESGIEPHMAERIAKAFEDGGEIRDGVHLPNTADWTDKEARRVFEGAVARDADIAVVTPGQEKPLWMSHPILSVLGQFKSFTAAATERVLISNLQRRDAQVLQGMIFSMGLGMLSYKLNSLTGGQPTSDKPQDWVKEAISRGNLLGWFEEGNALASKVTRGGVDIYRMIGADKPLSRYASRSAMDQILGPTAGKIGGILAVGSAASKPSEWNESDSKAMRRLVGGQNVFYLRNLFDQVEKSGNKAFGIEMKGKPENR
jgi:hypothetical protein